MSKYEIIAKEFLPAIRSIIAKDLMKTYNMNQTEIAKKMKITQPAISQYVRKIRGKKEIKNENILNEVKILTEKFYKNKLTSGNLDDEIFRICINNKLN